MLLGFPTLLDSFKYGRTIFVNCASEENNTRNTEYYTEEFRYEPASMSLENVFFSVQEVHGDIAR